MNEFRADLIHLRRARRLAAKIGTGVALALVLSMISGFLAVFWQGFMHSLQSWRGGP